MKSHYELAFIVGVRVVPCPSELDAEAGWKVVVEYSDGKVRVLEATGRLNAYTGAADFAQMMTQAYDSALEELKREKAPVAPQASPAARSIPPAGLASTQPKNKLRPPKTDYEKWTAKALAILAGNDPDGASVVNDVGFNKVDGDFGHSLADLLTKRGGLTEKQWSAAGKLVAKYHKQVGAPPTWTDRSSSSKMTVVSETLGKEKTESFLPDEQLAGEKASRESEQPKNLLRPNPDGSPLADDDFEEISGRG